MNVFLTFDIEVWCNGWSDLDGAFPGSFERYVYGHSHHGDYALPKTLEMLKRHGLAGVFFVEPLFASRFGAAHLEVIVKLIRDAGQEVQLHLHPEWTDEAREPIIENCHTKRQHLSYYTLDEQFILIRHARRMLEAAGSGPIKAFRSGSFAANRDTFDALQRNSIWLDTSLNRCHDISAPDLRSQHRLDAPFSLCGVSTFPVMVFKDGFGSDRPAQVGACSFGEMRDTLWSAYQGGVRDYVVVSHNFEMLKPGSCKPDWVVVKRFEQLCAFLAAHRSEFEVRGFDDDLQLSAQTDAQHALKLGGPDTKLITQPKASATSTVRRYAEQLQRRLA